MADAPDRKPLQPDFDPGHTTWRFIHDILAMGRDIGKGDLVARHLVRATLQLSFPNVDKKNEAVGADSGTAGGGGFYVGDTVFFATDAPTLKHFEECNRRLQDGGRVYFLVSDWSALATRQLAQQHASAPVAVQSIESFVAQHIEAKCGFVAGRVSATLCQLIDTYNQRVSTLEHGGSVTIERPPRLAV